MIIGVDFDGTLCEHKFPDIGKPFQKRIDKLKELRSKGAKLILWTCRNMDYERNVLQEAVDWCRERGLEFDAINDDLKTIKESHFGRSKSTKIFADFYIDDRNVSLDWLDAI